jgi:hypothetical protein
MPTPDMKVAFPSSSGLSAIWAVVAAVISAASGESTHPLQKEHKWVAPLTPRGQPDLAGRLFKDEDGDYPVGDSQIRNIIGTLTFSKDPLSSWIRILITGHLWWWTLRTVGFRR